MNIQIVNSETGEPIYTKQGLKLEAEIASHESLPRWRVVARHRRKVMIDELAHVVGELREQTRFV